MTQEVINIGAQANDGSGDTIRNAGLKINTNFTELYAQAIHAGDIKFRGNNITSESSNADIVLKPSGTGNVVFPALTFEDNNIKLTRSNDDLKISAHGSGSVVIEGIGFAGVSITGTDSAIININENLIVDTTLNAGATTLPSAVTLNSTLDVTGATTLSTLTVTGTTTLSGTTSIDNLTFNDGIIGSSSNADIILTPGGTGTIVLPAFTIDDNSITGTRTNENININASGTGDVLLGPIRINGTTLDSSDSASINMNEGVIVDGTINADTPTFDGAVIANSTLGVTGATTLSTMTVSGASSLAGTTTIDNLTFNDNIIGSSSNADIILTPGGTGSLVLPGLTINDNNITGTRSNEDLNITPSGTGIINVGAFKFAGTSISSDDSTTVNVNDAVIVDGTMTANTPTFNGAVVANSTLDVTSGTTLSSLTVSGASSFVGPVPVDNLTFNDNIIATSSNADLILSPGGTGVVNVSNLTIDSSINLTDNVIKVTRSNDNLVLSPNGSGNVEIISGLTTADVTTTGNVDITGAKTITGLLDLRGIQIKDNTITTDRSSDNFELSGNGSGKVVVDKVEITNITIDNIVIGGTTPAAGTFTSFPSFTNTDEFDAAGVKLKDNTITAHRSNDDLGFAANGSGYVNINGNLITGGINLPNSDGNTGQLLRTDGNGQLAWFTNPILLGQSDIQDARNTIGFSSLTEIDANTAVGAHENIGAGSDSVFDEFDQSKYDSAWYLCLQRYDAADSSVEYAGFKTTIAQGTTDGSTFDAFDGTSQIIKTNSADEILATSSDIRSSVGKVRFKGQAGTLADGSSKSTFNALTFFRVGLGDNDSSGYTDGNIATKVTADLDSAIANLDTWAHASYRGAKYYVSVNNTTTNEVMNAELLIVHNGSDAFLQDYNIISTNSGNTPLATFTADISGSDVRLRGSNGTAGTCRVTMYRILLADNESGSSGTYESVIAAQTVSNTDTTTINTDSFRGQSNPDMSSQKVINSWAKTSFDSVFYHMIQKDNTNNEFIMNKLSLNHGVGADGSTEAAGVADSHVLKSGEMNDISAFDASINGSNVELKATGQSDGSTDISNNLQYYAIGLGPDTTTATSGNIGTHAGVTAGGNNETEIDHVIAEGTTQGSVAAERSGAEFTASQFNGALYHVVTKDTANGSFETQKISVLHNFNDAFLTSSAVTRSDVGDTHPTFDADMVTAGDSTSKIRLRMTDSDGSSVVPSNTMGYYRVGIGDDDSTGYVGEIGLVHDITHVSIIDSSVVNLDTFTKAPHAAAKYFINVKNQSTGETSNIEALVTHDNTNAYITSYNEHFSGNNSLITLTADIDSTTVRLRGSATSGASTKVIVNRIVAFADTESDEATTDSTRKVIGNVTTSSTATTFDTFQSSDTDAVHYVVCGQNGADEKFICEASVVTDGTGVFIAQGPNVSTKGTDMLELTATISGGTVSVKASSTSGASTVVSAYAVRLKAPVDNTITLDSFAHADYRGAKYYISADDTINGHISNIECLVVHNGTDAYISSFGESNSHNSLITLTADISGSNLRLLATPTSADIKMKFYRIRLADNESNATGTDANTVGAVSISSSATAIDTFVDTQFTGGHYVVVARNASEGTAEITEATVLTNGTTAFVAQANNVSSKATSMLTFSAAHDGSSTVTLSAASTAGGSTTVNAYRIHIKVEDAFAHDVIDTFAHSTYQLANYIVVGKNAANQSQIAELMVATDGAGSYILQEGANISTHSTTTPLMNFTTAHNGSNVELRAENSLQNTDTTVNMYRIHLARAEGAPSSVATLDTFDKTEFRSAKYNVSISDPGSGTLGLYETLDVNVMHDGTDVYLSTFGRATNHTTDLVEFTADISGDNVRLRGTISNTNTHTVTVVRRVMKV